MSILDIFNEISQTSSRNEKEQILSKYKDNTLLESAIKKALDPRISYFFDKFDNMSIDNDQRMSLFEALELIPQLTSREKSGNQAIEFVQHMMNSLSYDDATVLKRVIQKDLKIGMGAKTINKVFDNLIYIHPYMRCTSFSEKALAKIKYPAISQEKIDGMYVDVVVDHMGDVVVYSRYGNIIKIDHEELLEFYSEHKSMVFQGELTIYNPETCKILDRQSGNGYINSDEFNDEFARFDHWDVIPLGDWKRGECNLSYNERTMLLRDLISDHNNNDEINRINLVDTRIVESKAEAYDHFREKTSQGKEGTILKNFDTNWKSHTSPNQVKFKVQCECEFEIISIKEGENGSKYEGMVGSVEFKSIDGKIISSAGSGLTDKLRKLYWEHRLELIGRIVTIKFNDIILKDGETVLSLFLPIFIELRSDKFEADSYERILEQFEAAKQV